MDEQEKRLDPPAVDPAPEAAAPLPPAALSAPDGPTDPPRALAPARRWGAGAAAVLVALGALLGGAGGTAATYALMARSARSAGSPATLALPAAVRGNPVVFSGDVNIAQIYRKTAPAVVQIVAGRRGSGTGFIFDGRGYILTNFHVIEGAREVDVRLDGDVVLKGTVLGVARGDDLAVVKVEPGNRNLPVLLLGDSDAIEPGEPAVAIGFPLNEGKSVTAGVISGKGRQSEAPNGDPLQGLIQTDAALNPGNSGGPLINAAGEVVGVNSQASGRAFGGIGFAVPINRAKQILPDLIAGREVQRPWLGISGQAITAELASELKLPVQSGILVANVVRGGTADAAGVRGETRTYSGEVVPGDVIVAVDGRPVSQVSHLSDYLATRHVGDPVTITVYRDGQRVDLRTTLRPWPETQMRGR